MCLGASRGAYLWHSKKRRSDSKLKPPDLLPLYAYGCVGIVPIISPGRMMKMDDEITVVRDNPIAETDLAYGLPVGNRLPLALRKENKP